MSDISCQKIDVEQMVTSEEEVKEYLKRISSEEQEIKNIAKGILLKKLEQLGYTDEIIYRLEHVEDTELRTILLRDFKECELQFVQGKKNQQLLWVVV